MRDSSVPHSISGYNGTQWEPYRLCVSINENRGHPARRTALRKQWLLAVLVSCANIWSSLFRFIQRYIKAWVYSTSWNKRTYTMVSFTKRTTKKSLSCVSWCAKMHYYTPTAARGYKGISIPYTIRHSDTSISNYNEPSVEHVPNCGESILRIRHCEAKPE